MTEASNIASPALPPTETRPSGYQAAREVRVLAAVSRNSQTPHEQRALSRLDRILEGDRPLRDDVPRGFYLNIRV